MIAHACAARVTGKNVYSVNSSWVRFRVSPPMPSCLAVTPAPSTPLLLLPVRWWFQIRPQQWGAHASSGCHATVSAVGALMACCHGEPKTWVGGGARCWGVGGWYHMSALPGTGTPLRVPPERKRNRLWRERRDRPLVRTNMHLQLANTTKIKQKNSLKNVNKGSIHDRTVRLD